MNHSIIIAKKSGYCMGVKKAFLNSFKVKSQNNDTCIYGEMVHNKYALQSLYDKGIIIKNDIETIITDKNIKNVIIRAHGIPPQEEKKLIENNKNVFDFTCPKVKQVQLLAKKLSDDDFSIIIFGKKNHPEVIGIIGYCNNNYSIIKDIDEAKKLSLEEKKIAIISQTTMNSEIFSGICDFFKTKYNNLKIFNTLCNSPILIQNEALILAKKVDLMLIVGDKKSANTSTLYDKVSKIASSYFIETTNDINLIKIKEYKKIGITGGSSTPQWQMEGIKSFLEKNLN